ncbi:unnamed protein product [Protopolystoma xenopodis]|uniref:Uncharacterized protein n=1 Tax=Protopolystoma xenopodis TaxID=117903 RepID=A0A448WFB3_9PLAT|nr:unnamed protein product [Protopolystoma xenopodis]
MPRLLTLNETPASLIPIYPSVAAASPGEEVRSLLAELSGSGDESTENESDAFLLACRDYAKKSKSKIQTIMRQIRQVIKSPCIL